MTTVDVVRLGSQRQSRYEARQTLQQFRRRDPRSVHVTAQEQALMGPFDRSAIDGRQSLLRSREGRQQYLGDRRRKSTIHRVHHVGARATD